MQRVGCDDCPDLTEPSPVDRMRDPRQPGSLSVREPEGLPAQLLAKDVVLGEQVGDYLLVLAVHPPSQHENEELQRERHHRDTLARMWT